MTKWSLAYQIVYFYVRFVFSLFYKKIYTIGKKNIPKNKPVIFAANHQNALMDPLSIICTNNMRQSVFLTRADIFNKPLLLKIFTFLKMLPVYRIRDGADSLQKNNQIFNKSVEILEAGMSVALFPEATHTDKRRLRPLKKAVPRIAFLAEEKNNFELDLQIVPVGLYYENYEQSYSDLLVKYGEPISLKNFEKQYKENNQKGFLAFKNKLEESLKELIIHIEDKDNYSLYEDVRLFFRPFMLKNIELKKNTTLNNFNADILSIKKMNNYFSNESNEINMLSKAMEQYKAKCKALKINPFKAKRVGTFNILLKILLFTIFLPIFVYGFINNILYYFLTKKLVNIFKDRQFHSSVKFGLTLFAAPVIYLIHTLIFYLISSNGELSFYYFLSLPITALISNIYRYSFKKFISDFNLWKLYFINKKELNKFYQYKKDLKEILENVME